MTEQVQSDTFNPPHHKLRPSIEFKLNALLQEYTLQFVKDEMSIGTTPLTEMTFDTGTSDPVSQKPYLIGMKNYQWVKEDNEKLLTVKIICSSRWSWSAPIIVVPQGDGGEQLVIDYHALNKVTRKFTWPMPKVEDIFFKIKWSKVFLNSGFMSWLSSYTSRQIFHTKNCIQFTIWEIWICQSTIWPQSGSNIFSRTDDLNFEGFGLCNSILGWHNNLQQNSRWTSIPHQTVFEKLWAAKLSMKLSKCHFFSRDSIFRTHSKHQEHLTITLKYPSHPEHVPTKNTQTGLCLPQFSRLLQKIHQKFHQNS